MKKYILISILAVFILLFIGINVLMPNFTQHRFEIFAASGGDLIDNLVPIKREFPKDIGVKLTLERTPLITENDIESYDWSKHQIKCKNEIELNRYFIDHRFFVVVVDGICIYYGTFESDSAPTSGISIKNPVI